MANNSKVLGALLIGAAAGAVLGILFAPAKGEDTRKKIAEKAGDLSDELTSKIQEGKSVLNQLASRVLGASENLAGRAQEEIRNGNHKVKEAVNNL